jgi:16S rRNA processing protein RimM
LPDRPILLGVIGRAHGVRGLVRVTSHTADPADLAGYGPLSDPSGRRFTLRWMGEGIAEIAEIIDGKAVKVADRTAAERLTNTKLFIERDQLPAPDADEYYLADLIGLAAIGTDGAPIGVVSAVHDYGAGASLEVDRESVGSLLIPFTAASVPEIDIGAGRVMVVPPDEIEVVVPPDEVEVVVPPDEIEVVETSPAHRPPTSNQRHPPACPGDPTPHNAGTDPREDDAFAAIDDGNAEAAA